MFGVASVKFPESGEVSLVELAQYPLPELGKAEACHAIVAWVLQVSEQAGGDHAGDGFHRVRTGDAESGRDVLDAGRRGGPSAGV